MFGHNLLACTRMIGALFISEDNVPALSSSTLLDSFHTAVAWVGESQISARLKGGDCCPSAAPADEGPPTCWSCLCFCFSPPVPGFAEGVARTSGWLTEGSVFLLLILCFLFFSMVAWKEEIIYWFDIPFLSIISKYFQPYFTMWCHFIESLFLQFTVTAYAHNILKSTTLCVFWYSSLVPIVNT